MSAPAHAAPVHKDDLHAALRALPTREEMRAGFAQLRDDHKAIRRRLFGALVVLLGLLANNLLA